MADDGRRHVKVYALHVKDRELYRRYREQMTPLLHRAGGRFGYDFVVSEVLKSETNTPIDRVFTMIFPDRDAADRFFSAPEYLAVRKTFFEPAVGSVTTIAAFDENT